MSGGGLIWDIERMRDRSEDQRLEKYTILDPIIEQYGNTCKRIAMINLDKNDLANYLMDFIKTVIETANYKSQWHFEL